MQCVRVCGRALEMLQRCIGEGAEFDTQGRTLTQPSNTRMWRLARSECDKGKSHGGYGSDFCACYVTKHNRVTLTSKVKSHILEHVLN